MITPRRDPEILLRRYWDKPDTPVVTAGLSVLSIGYRIALAIRERAYAWRLLSTGRLPCPVVATAIVLDDGFQHRTLHKSLEILVVNGRAPWGNQRLFPRGMLREPLSALARADLLVVTNPPSEADARAVTDTVRRHNHRVP